MTFAQIDGLTKEAYADGKNKQKKQENLKKHETPNTKPNIKIEMKSLESKRPKKHEPGSKEPTTQGKT